VAVEPSQHQVVHGYQSKYTTVVRIVLLRNLREVLNEIACNGLNSPVPVTSKSTPHM
jgi:hypothetical protein